MESYVSVVRIIYNIYIHVDSVHPKCGCTITPRDNNTEEIKVVFEIGQDWIKPVVKCKQGHEIDRYLAYAASPKYDNFGVELVDAFARENKENGKVQNLICNKLMDLYYDNCL